MGSRNCGLTSRRTTCKIPTTSNTSLPTKRWLRFSVPTVSVLSVWPNSSQLTSPLYNRQKEYYKRYEDNDAPRKTCNLDTNHLPGFKIDTSSHLVLTNFCILLKITMYVQATTSNLIILSACSGGSSD